MSWDVYIVNSTEKINMEEREEDLNLPSLGTRKSVQEKISSLFPETDWTDPSYAHLDNGQFVGHINLGNDDEMDGTFMINCYGGDNPYHLITTLCKTYGWLAYDTTLSDYINLDKTETEGWDKFQNFRNKIIEQYGGEVGGKSKHSPKKWWKFW